MSSQYLNSDLHRRKGRFKISRDLIIHTPELANTVQRNVTIVQTETNFMTDDVTYWGLCPDFDLVEVGTIPPLYKAIINITDKETTVKWVKVDE